MTVSLGATPLDNYFGELTGAVSSDGPAFDISSTGYMPGNAATVPDVVLASPFTDLKNWISGQTSTAPVATASSASGKTSGYLLIGLSILGLMMLVKR